MISHHRNVSASYTYRFKAVLVKMNDNNSLNNINK